MASFWEEIPLAPADPIISLNALYASDPDPRKLNLGVGAYRTEKSEPYVLPVVRRVETQLASDPNANHEYLPIEGLADFRDGASRLIFGRDSELLAQGKVVTVQSLSGTGALRIGLAFLQRFYRLGQNSSAVYAPNPSWPIHRNLVPVAGLGEARTYRYYDNARRGLDWDGMQEDLLEAPEASVIILHGCAHNPTGADPTAEQWDEILRICKIRHHLVFFDVAYQGFASGSLGQDAAAVRLFARQLGTGDGIPMMVGQSFAKNMGLYGERVGALHVVLPDAAMYEPVLGNLKLVIRTMYSSPPGFGAKVAARVLCEPELFAEWENELVQMSDRIREMRSLLRENLEALGTPGPWDHITSQIGMFSYTGLTEEQVRYLRDQHHVYMTSNGRISMAGLTRDSVGRFAQAVLDAVTNVTSNNKL
uniref:Aspartate aminotransferase n=1 Tax=Compsopogon caeruleus TaxID=31354 RepID=A0A6T6AZK7_9RHOD|mmetsp:Transcript_13243/g.26899  ORF Transcript_13243/g.26899 Transcript_13243/m.26899 type:complete len:421 (+) Transcript_13243:439-1701(+)|eukprot:CAMPEP_0184686368 /NCGR_PEP_ID=MMETSP0312-20130426/22130_1 /TAXON_ID=31354 /ORGANISM="Compsopogon coeruleus, Strain SAG 36.94" /LENGTH=420 /DNA_ID=CAMNT_0027141361 /DNA_START=2502 /DNA_END=3764 /DNA_ORIENTATION=+